MRPNILFAFLGTLMLTADQRGALAQGVNLDTAAIEQATGPEVAALHNHIVAIHQHMSHEQPRATCCCTTGERARPSISRGR